MTTGPHGSGAVLRSGAPRNEAELAVVLLHGRGGSAQDMLDLGYLMHLDLIHFVAPEATGHTWYPLSFLAPREANEPYLSSALDKVATLVTSLEQAGLERERILIGGFSQGACVATEFVARHPARYGGLLAFTGGLIGPPGSIVQPPGDLLGTPALLLSGDPDPHVPWPRVEETAQILSGMGAEVKTKRFPGRPHIVTPEELDLGGRLFFYAMNKRPGGNLKLDELLPTDF